MARPFSAMPSSKDGRSSFSPSKKPAEFSFPDGFGEPIVVRPSTVGGSRSTGLFVRPSSPQRTDKKEDFSRNGRADSSLHSPSDSGKPLRPGSAVPKLNKTWANPRMPHHGSPTSCSQELPPQLVVSRPGTANLLRKEQSSPDVSSRSELSGVHSKSDARLSTGFRKSADVWGDGSSKKKPSGATSSSLTGDVIKWNPENRSSVLELQSRIEQSRLEAQNAVHGSPSSYSGGYSNAGHSSSYNHTGSSSHGSGSPFGDPTNDGAQFNSPFSFDPSSTGGSHPPPDPPPLTEQASYSAGAGVSRRKISISTASPHVVGDPGSPFNTALSPKAGATWASNPPPISAVTTPSGFLDVWPATSTNNRRVTYTVEAVAAGQLTRHERGSRPTLFLSLENALNATLAGIVHAADKEWGHLTPAQRKLRADAESVAAHRTLLMGLAENFATYRPLLLRVACAYDDMIAREEKARADVLQLEEELEELLADHKRELAAATLQSQASIHDLEAALALERNACSRYKARAQAAEEENRLCREREGEHKKIVAEHVRQNGVVLRACARSEAQLAELKNATDTEIERLSEIVKASISLTEYNALKHEHRRVVLEGNARMAEMQNQLDVTTRRHQELMKEKNAMVRERPLLTPRPGATAAGSGKFSAADIPTKPTAEWVAELLASHAALEHKVSLLQARLRGRRSLPKLGDLLKTWLSLPRVDWFRGLGPSPEVPAFLRCSHRVFNRNMDLDGCLQVVRQARARLRVAAVNLMAKAAAEKAALGGGSKGAGAVGEDGSHGAFAKLDVGEAIAAIIHEQAEDDEQGYIQLGYSLVDAVRRFRYDPEVAVFYRVLRGHLPVFYYAEEAAWITDIKAACRKVESKFGDKAGPAESAAAASPKGDGKKDKGKKDAGHIAGGNISKKEFWKILKAQFPGRSDKHWQQLGKVLDAEFPGNTVNLATLYTGFGISPPPTSKKSSSGEPHENTLGGGAGAGGGFQSRTGLCLLLQYAEERVEYQQDLAAVLWAATGANSGGMATEPKIKSALMSLETVFQKKGKEGGAGGVATGGNASKVVNMYIKRGLGFGKSGGGRLDTKAPISIPLFIHRLQAGKLVRMVKRADCQAFGVHPEGGEGVALGPKAQATLLEVRQKVAVQYENDWWNRLFCDVSDALLTSPPNAQAPGGGDDDGLGPLSRNPHAFSSADDDDERQHERRISGGDEDRAGNEDREGGSAHGSMKVSFPPAVVPGISLGPNGGADEAGKSGKDGGKEGGKPASQQPRMSAFLVARRTKNPVSEEIRDAESALCRESDRADDETESNGDADVADDGLGVASGPYEGNSPFVGAAVSPSQITSGPQSPMSPSAGISGAVAGEAGAGESPEKDSGSEGEGEEEEEEPELDSFALALQEWKDKQAKMGHDAAGAGMELLPAQKSLRAAHTYLEEDLDLDSYLRQIDDSANKIKR